MSATTIITGGAGFLGRRLAERLATRRGPGDEIVLVDRVGADVADPIRSLERDVTAPGALDDLLAGPPRLLYHLASVVSAGAEQDWDQAIDVNVAGLVEIVRSCARSGVTHRVVLTSSVAVFGGDLATGPVGDDVKQTPRSTYGMTKAFGELLIADATRKGMIDGRTGRLPTVVVRPGAPNLAASGFASGMFREPLAGVPSVVPVALDVEMVLIGTDTAVACLDEMGRLDGDRLGASRALGLPGVTVTVGEMVAALQRLDPEAASLLTFEVDPGISAVVASWPALWDDGPARALGLPADRSLDDIVAAYRAAL